ncbi:MAG TPA: prepilin-type N-terminal cleavage/methylation domain-containing protein [Gemmatimonadaceae bacterium]|nr:prepilin-type N-terminal cleavage/methylation domain-containing protein [Gemmatimonadaceae bacterium]
MLKGRRGFTLIELLIVVVIIGILASFAIPNFRNTKGKARAAGLKSDLRNLATAQEAYFYDNITYTTNLTGLNVTLSPGTTITWGSVSGSGWAASITHPMAFPITCAIFVGTAAPVAPATVEGQLTCQ